MKSYSRRERQRLHWPNKEARRFPLTSSRNTVWYALIGIVLLACIVLLWCYVIVTLVAEGVL